MARETVASNGDFTLWYYPELRIVHHRMHRRLAGEPFRELLTRGAVLLEEHRACKWLSEDQENGPTTREDLAWNRACWFPRVLAAGWKYWALVTPGRPVARMNTKLYQAEFAAAGVTIRTFTGPEAGLEWLGDQP